MIDEDLDPELKILLEALLETDGNQTKAAQLTGKHRNTVRAGHRKIREKFLAARGFKPGDLGAQHMAPISDPSSTSAHHVKAAARALQLLRPWSGDGSRNKLSGTQWRILLWVLLENPSASTKSHSIPLGRDRACENSIHRVSILRAGAGLIVKNRILRAFEYGKLRNPQVLIMNCPMRRRFSSRRDAKKQRLLSGSGLRVSVVQFGRTGGSFYGGGPSIQAQEPLSLRFVRVPTELVAGGARSSRFERRPM